VGEAVSLTRRDDAAEILRFLQVALREPAFASALTLLASDTGQDVERETVHRSQLEAFATNRKG
jgi:hypothetical protein